ncbi:DNA-binding transcriptional regulator CytR [soil metagenome]
MRTATQTELARKLGLSRSTVAAALNPNSTIKLSTATRQLVEAEALKLNYRPNHNARLMRGMKSGMIGVFHFGGLSQVAAERAWHASRALEAAGFKVLPYDLSWSRDGAKVACETMLDAKVEGVLVAGLNDPSGLMELNAIRMQGMPMVTLSGNELEGVPHVRGDANKAIQQMTEHLLELGKKRLLFLTHHSPEIRPGTYMWAYTERLKGFQSALKSARGTIGEEFTSASGAQGRVLTGDSTAEVFDPFKTSKLATEKALQWDCLPDAIICGNDEWAIGAMAAIRESGRRVPGDIAVTGYDNISQGQYLDVPLTTVAQPSEMMALHAVNMLRVIIKEEKEDPMSLLTQFPCELVIRKSCGA